MQRNQSLSQTKMQQRIASARSSKKRRPKNLFLILAAFFTVAFFSLLPFSCNCETDPVTSPKTNALPTEISRWLDTRYSTNTVVNDLSESIYQHLQSAASQTTPIDSLKNDIFIWLDATGDIYFDAFVENEQTNVLQWRNKKATVANIVTTNVDTLVTASNVTTTSEIIAGELVGTTNITIDENIVHSIVLSANIPSAFPKSDLANNFVLRRSSASAIIVDYEGDDRVGFAVDTSTMGDSQTIAAFYLVTKADAGNGNYHIPLGYDNLQQGKRFFSKKQGHQYDFRIGNDSKGNVFVGESSYRSSIDGHPLPSTIALYSGTNLAISKTALNGILGSFPTADNQGGEQHISELIVFTKDPSDSQHSNVVKYLIEKWHIPRNKVTIGLHSDFVPNGSQTIANAFDSNRSTYFHLKNSPQNDYPDGKVLFEYSVYDSVLEPQGPTYLASRTGYSSGVNSLHLRTGYNNSGATLRAAVRVQIFRSNDLAWYTLTNLSAENTAGKKDLYFYLLDSSNDFLKYRLLATGAGGVSGDWLAIDDFIPSSVTATSSRVISFSNTLADSAKVRQRDTYVFEVGFTNYLLFDKDVFGLTSADFETINGSVVAVDTVGTGSSNYALRLKVSNVFSDDSAFSAGLSLTLRENAVTNALGEVNIGHYNDWYFVPLNPFDGFDIGHESTPTFVDLDGDGDVDMLSGRVSGSFVYYSNGGNGNIFTEYKFVAANPFYNTDVGNKSAPDFADIDGDGDMDMLSGRGSGSFVYYSNGGNGSFALYMAVAGNPFNGFDVGNDSTPAFADIDGDGDMDMLSGRDNGKFFYYSNDGNGSFTEYKQVAGNPFNGFDVGNLSTPAFADIDGDGDVDMLSGESFGRFVYYSNGENGSFSEYKQVAGNPFNGVLVEGAYSAPVFADIDGDGDLDMLSGEGYGGFVYYKNVAGVYIATE